MGTVQNPLPPPPPIVANTTAPHSHVLDCAMSTTDVPIIINKGKEGEETNTFYMQMITARISFGTSI